MHRFKEFFYEVELSWNAGAAGILRSVGLPDIEVVAPTEFSKGKRNKWTPEHLLAGAISSSLMTTFMEFAEKTKLEVSDYTSMSFVKFEKKENGHEATEILVRPTIKLISDKDMPTAILLLEKAEQNCPIRKTIKMIVEVHPQFEFLNRGERIKA